jgi:hypothetical protein
MQIIYRSDDGAEFDDVSECARHEQLTAKYQALESFLEQLDKDNEKEFCQLLVEHWTDVKAFMEEFGDENQD